jgi:hypothetical protein
MNKTTLNNIQIARNDAIAAALKLKDALKPVEVSINKLVADKGKQLDQMSLTETVNVANLLINLFAETE